MRKEHEIVLNCHIYKVEKEIFSEKILQYCRKSFFYWRAIKWWTFRSLLQKTAPENKKSNLKLNRLKREHFSSRSNKSEKSRTSRYVCEPAHKGCTLPLFAIYKCVASHNPSILHTLETLRCVCKCRLYCTNWWLFESFTSQNWINFMWCT